MQLFRALVTILALVVPILAAGQERPRVTPVLGEEPTATVPYAVVKKPSIPFRPREALRMLPGPYPARGITVMTVGFGGSRRWTVVDFDARTVEIFRGRANISSDGKTTADVYRKVVRPLSLGEVNSVIEEANAIWNPPVAQLTSPRVGPTDSWCEAALFDGRDVVDDGGTACPAEMEDLLGLVDRIEAPTPLP